MRWSLRTKAILLFFVLVLLAVGITSTVDVWYTCNLLNESNVEDIQAEADKFAYAGQLAMAVKDLNELERLASSFISESSVCFLAVYDANSEKPIIQQVRDQNLWTIYLSGEGEGSAYVSAQRPIVLADLKDDSLAIFLDESQTQAGGKSQATEQVLGHVVIARSTEEINEALKRQILVTTASVFIVLILGGLGIYLSINTWSVRLNKLVAASASMSRGDFDCEIPPAAPDEVGRLAGAFEHMRQAVRQHDSELRSLNDNLQQRVEQRTAALVEAKNAAEQSAVSLQLQQRLLREVIDNIPLYVMWKDRRGVYRGCNNAVAELLGCASPDEVIGKTDRDLPHAPCFSKTACEQEQQVIETGKPVLMVEESLTISDDQTTHMLSSRVPLCDADGRVVGVLTTCADISDHKRIEVEREQLHARLVDASRQAGMAEVATGVLHNVGNVLNSINISTTVLGDCLRQSKTASLIKVVQLLKEHQGQLDQYMHNDPKGRQLVPYLHKLNEMIELERNQMIDEIRQLAENVEHIKHIVTMQQSLARTGSAIESVSLPSVLDEAVQINLSALQRHRIPIDRQIEPNLPLINTDKHKVIQILVNLISNAKYAMQHMAPADKQLMLRIDRCDEGMRIRVTDNGIGIAADNLTRIFSHGFTTRTDGHGFGLHYGALAARELGGDLSVSSDGPDCGATFTLVLPLQATPVAV
ncbi:MAG: PAS domain-containing protein [Phycisphaeraceae bacterium]|nr:PAS domain-containing protein [Phycisphaeraceae bacterium]